MIWYSGLKGYWSLYILACSRLRERHEGERASFVPSPRSLSFASLAQPGTGYVYSSAQTSCCSSTPIPTEPTTWTVSKIHSSYKTICVILLSDFSTSMIWCCKEPIKAGHCLNIWQGLSTRDHQLGYMIIHTQNEIQSSRVLYAKTNKQRHHNQHVLLASLSDPCIQCSVCFSGLFYLPYQFHLYLCSVWLKLAHFGCFLAGFLYTWAELFKARLS